MTAVWLSVTDLAQRRGVSKQGLSQRLARLESQGLVSTRPGPNRAKLVNVAEFLRAVDAAGDVIRETNGAGDSPPAAPLADLPGPAGPEALVYSREQARNTAIRADLAQLELDERLGRLLPVEDVAAAMARCSEAMARAIEQLVAGAEDNAAAVAREGVIGARTFLRAEARRLLQRLAREMRLLADEDDGEPEAEAAE